MVTGLVGVAGKPLGWLIAVAMSATGVQRPTVKDTVRDIGPFNLQGQPYTVVLHEKHVMGVTAGDPDFQSTLVKIEIKDSAGIAHYQKSFAHELAQDGREFAETLTASVALLRGRERNGLLISYGSLPSAPLGGQSWHVFGTFDGKLVPFSSEIYLEGDLVNEWREDGVRTLAEPGLQGEVLDFRIWTGNFFVVYPVRVDFILAKAIPAWRCQPRCPYRVEANRQPPPDDMTFVRLHAEASESDTPQHVVIRPNSSVDILAAEGEIRWNDDNGVGLLPGDDFWLKVRIDGKEGWIHTQEDFAAIGLPQAG